MVFTSPCPNDGHEKFSICNYLLGSIIYLEVFVFKNDLKILTNYLDPTRTIDRPKGGCLCFSNDLLYM